MKRRTFSAAIIPFVLLLVLPSAAWAGHTLKPEQKGVVETWLRGHPAYRLAKDEDCGCDDNLHTMRVNGYGGDWKPIPDYQPYIVTGDLNSDGVADFAVAVIKRSKQMRKFTLLVFNGPLHSWKASPAFVGKDLDLTSAGFFYGPPHEKPYRLLVGRFESEPDVVLVPNGNTYRLDDTADERE